MPASPVSTLRCAACGAAPPANGAYTYRCAAAGTHDRDHLIARTIDLSRVRFAVEASASPFLRHRELLHAYWVARAGGIEDAAWVAMAGALDRAVARVDGRGFVTTPFAQSVALGLHLGLERGGVWIKDETGNVAGSHKARHLMGLALHLAAVELTGRTTRAESDRRGLAIASCGNAALAAAVIARADQRPLRVYIPPEADRRIVRRLAALGASIEVCDRVEGERGDPCLRAFRAAVARGALPFCVQGSENGLCVEGGETLGWEIAAALERGRIAPDRLFVQVGGGALASATAQALAEARVLHVIRSLPRLHAVQTAGGAPLRRAYDRVRGRILAALGEPESGPTDAARDAALAARLTRDDAVPHVTEALAYAREHRSEFMWPWESPPQSAASGILDDETYDWHAVVAATIGTGGWPVVVAESLVTEAHALAREAAGIPADATGSAGLAGLIALRRANVAHPDERSIVLFTGRER